MNIQNIILKIPKIQKELFNEIKGRIKLDDESYLIKIKTMNIGQKLLKRKLLNQIKKKIGYNEIEGILEWR